MHAQSPETDVRENRRLAILGGGGHARVVAEAARMRGWVIDGFVDDDRLAPLASSQTWLGRFDDWLANTSGRQCPIVAVGDLSLRRRIIGALPMRARVIMHPSAVVSPDARLDEGVFVGPGAIINAGATIGAHAIINSGAIVEHDCYVGVNAHIAPGAVLGGEVRVDDDTLIGLGARVLPGVRIGEQSVVGGAALVIENVGAGQRVVGVPARALQPSVS